MNYEQAGITFRQFNELNDRISSFMRLSYKVLNLPAMRPESIAAYWMQSVIQPEWIKIKMNDQRFVKLLYSIMDEKKKNPEVQPVIPGYCEFRHN